jgi:hypothetical protein
MATSRSDRNRSQKDAPSEKTMWEAVEALQAQVAALTARRKTANDLLPQVPIGGIIGWLGTVATIPRNYEVVTEADGKFLKGHLTTPGTAGGSATHTHANGTLAVTAHTTALDTPTPGIETRVTGANHVITGAVAAANNEPPSLTIIWIRRIS